MDILENVHGPQTHKDLSHSFSQFFFILIQKIIELLLFASATEGRGRKSFGLYPLANKM